MNYYGFAFPVKGFLIDGQLTQSEAIRQLDAAAQQLRGRYSVRSAESHGLARYRSGRFDDRQRGPAAVCAAGSIRLRHGRLAAHVAQATTCASRTTAERRIQRLVALMQMTYVGPPMIYYGTEAGMWGADDPCDRMPMVWPDMTYDPQQHAPREGSRPRDTVEFDRVLYDYYRAAVWLRRAHSALRRGAIEFIETDGEAKFLAFRRSDDSETLLVGLNRGDAEYRWQLPLAEGESLTQIFTASGNIEDFSLDRNAAGMTVAIPPRDGVVLELHRNE